MRIRWLTTLSLCLVLSLFVGCTWQLQDRPLVKPPPEEETTPEPEENRPPAQVPGPTDEDLFDSLEDDGPLTEPEPEIEDEPQEESGEEDFPEEQPPTATRELAIQEPLPPADPDQYLQAVRRATSPRRQAALTLTLEGVEFVLDDRPDVAQRRFEHAISLDPTCGHAYLALAELRFLQQQWREAMDLASKAALRLQGDTLFLSRAYLVAAKALVNEGRVEEAYEHAVSSVKIDRRNHEAVALLRELEVFLGLTEP